MRKLILAITIVLVCDYLLPSCANPQAPTGGPKDTIPPTLLEANPELATINFKGQEIELTFDEPVKADRLPATMIVTPRLDARFKTITKKNTLTLKFEDPFPDSTTFTLNFLEGITDITENNPAINLQYVFSTGSYIDSLSISGNVYNLLNNKPSDKAVVGLYSITDSLNLQIDKPTYFIKTNEDGNFIITNIKNGRYRLLAFEDGNNNLVFEGETESFGFKSDTINLVSDINNLHIPLIKQNVSNLRLISARPSTHYYEIKYSKSLDQIHTTPEFDHLFNLESNTLRLYKPEHLELGDSLSTIIKVLDSARNELVDTVFVKFNESTRKKESFELTIKPSGKKFLPTINYSFIFTKPVYQWDSSLIHFAKDSTYKQELTNNQFQWNANRTALKFTETFDTTSYVLFQKQRFDSLQLASSLNDSIPNDSLSENQNTVRNFKSNTSISMTIQPGAFISIEQDTLDLKTKALSFYSQKELGSILVNSFGFKPTDVIQLIDPTFKVIREYPYKTSLAIRNLPPGEYGIRILIDSNSNGKWSQGNFLKNIEPEEVYIYPEFTALRANWEITLNISK